MKKENDEKLKKIKDKKKIMKGSSFIYFHFLSYF